jgi:hypothetical protein
MEATSTSADIGSICDIKSLFNHSDSTNPCHARWAESKDLVTEERRMKEMGQSYAIVHRFSKDEDADGTISWKTHSIEIKSPRLRKTLDKAFQDYPNWYPDHGPYTFYPPFKPLVHRWDTLLEALKAEKDKSTKLEIQLFRHEIQPLLSGHFAALEQAKSTGLVSFKNLWLIFAPGDVMISFQGTNICATMLMSVDFHPATRECPAFWAFAMHQLDWNGSYCGYRILRKQIQEFENPILAIKLGLCPLSFYPNQQELRGTLLARGRKFEGLRGYHVKTCRGQKFMKEMNMKGEKVEVAKPVRRQHS